MTLQAQEIVLVWDAYRGWWIDTGFGIPEQDGYYRNFAEAICAAYALAALGQGAGRVLVRDGATWREAEPPTLLDWPTGYGGQQPFRPSANSHDHNQVPSRA